MGGKVFSFRGLPTVGDRMLYMQSFNVKEDKMLDFQMWTKKNEDAIRKSAPKGWTYKGTYAYVLGFGRYHAAVMWECAKYGDFDTWRENKDATWMRLYGEMQSLTMDDKGESVLLREIGDTRILEPKK